ncbi:hypothetical protein [Pedobacter sp. NJ-S-72]
MEKHYSEKLRRLKYGLMAIFMCFVFFCTSFAQAEELQREALKIERLDSYLKKIEQAYQVSFVYDAAQINKKHKY